MPVRGVTHMAAKVDSGANWPCTQLVGGGGVGTPLGAPPPPPPQEMRIRASAARANRFRVSPARDMGNLLISSYSRRVVILGWLFSGRSVIRTPVLSLSSPVSLLGSHDVDIGYAVMLIGDPECTECATRFFHE